MIVYSPTTPNSWVNHMDKQVWVFFNYKFKCIWHCILKVTNASCNYNVKANYKSSGINNNQIPIHWIVIGARHVVVDIFKSNPLIFKCWPIVQVIWIPMTLVTTSTILHHANIQGSNWSCWLTSSRLVTCALIVDMISTTCSHVGYFNFQDCISKDSNAPCNSKRCYVLF